MRNCPMSIFRNPAVWAFPCRNKRLRARSRLRSGCLFSSLFASCCGDRINLHTMVLSSLETPKTDRCTRPQRSSIDKRRHGTHQPSPAGALTLRETFTRQLCFIGALAASTLVQEPSRGVASETAVGVPLGDFAMSIGCRFRQHQMGPAHAAQVDKRLGVVGRLTVGDLPQIGGVTHWHGEREECLRRAEGGLLGVSLFCFPCDGKIKNQTITSMGFSSVCWK